MTFWNFILIVSSVCSDKLINNRFVSVIWLHDSWYKFPSVRENILAVCKCHSVHWRHCFTTWLIPVPADRLGYFRFSYASTSHVLKCVRCNAVSLFFIFWLFRLSHSFMFFWLHFLIFVCTVVCFVCTVVCFVCTVVCFVCTVVYFVCTVVCFVCTVVCFVCTVVCFVCLCLIL
jgi:hypothetical protein